MTIAPVTADLRTGTAPTFNLIAPHFIAESGESSAESAKEAVRQ